MLILNMFLTAWGVQPSSRHAERRDAGGFELVLLKCVENLLSALQMVMHTRSDGQPNCEVACNELKRSPLFLVLPVACLSMNVKNLHFPRPPVS